MYLSLVGPLIEQWRDWVLSSIKDEHRRTASFAISAHFLDELSIIIQPFVQCLSEHLANLGSFIVPYLYVLRTQGHQSRVEAVSHSVEWLMINFGPFSWWSPAYRHDRVHFETEKLRINGLEIQIRLLHLIDDVVRVTLRQLLQHFRFNFVCEDCRLQRWWVRKCQKHQIAKASWNAKPWKIDKPLISIQKLMVRECPKPQIIL